jgi:hypothetical protein
MTRRRIARSRLLGALLPIFAATPLANAQTPPQPVTPQLDFSGVLFGNFQYRTDSASRAQFGGKSPSKFDIERAYLNFRMPAGTRANIRITTDIFQQITDTLGQRFYRGWVVRLKYGYLQYDAVRNLGGKPGFNILPRIGMLQTVLVDYEEQFWPRYLGQVAVERYGFFSSADLGVSTVVALPYRFGEVYATITNGNGYTAPETDRYKDAALRLSVTPFGRDSTSLFQTLTVTPWGYLGAAGSRFQAGGTGQLGPITSGLARNRWGVFTGLRDRRLTAGLQFGKRINGVESGANTLASPRTAVDQYGTLVDGFAILRPLEWFRSGVRSPFTIVGRWDRFRPDGTSSGYLRYLQGGLSWEPTTRTVLTIDYQVQTPQSGLAGNPKQSGWFLNWQALF